MINWLSIIKHLLPNARAWRITVDKVLRNFFEGLTALPDDAKTFYDAVYSDIDPQLTRELQSWEAQFALPNTALTTQQRRDRLDGVWKALGGQSPRYIQDTLQEAGFDVYVHEWWVPSVLHPTGGSVDGDVTPVARDPFDYLDDGSFSGSSAFKMTDGSVDAMDGALAAMDGSTDTPAGYLLVNKVTQSPVQVIGDGSAFMQDGEGLAQDGGFVTLYVDKQYSIPADPTKYPYFLYIGGETFPVQANVLTSRRTEFEGLCLKICPAEQWLGMLVNYN